MRSRMSRRSWCAVLVLRSARLVRRSDGSLCVEDSRTHRKCHCEDRHVETNGEKYADLAEHDELDLF